MIKPPYDPEMLDDKNAKFCQQCRRFKQIRCFLSKDKMAICVLCSSCREKQKMRAREKRLARKRELQAMKEEIYLSDNSDSEEESVSTSIKSPTTENTSTQTNQNAECCPVPCSKWITVDANNLRNSRETVYNAKLIFRRQ